MSPTTIIPTHPPDTERLEAILPRLGLIDRIAVRLAMRAILRLERELEIQARLHAELSHSVDHARQAGAEFAALTRGLL